MAIGAVLPLALVPSAIDRKTGTHRVVGSELSAVPVGERVARVAGVREKRGANRRVAGIVGAVVIGLVAAPAIARRVRVGGSARAHMAPAALWRGVGQHGGVIASQRQRRRGVRERGAGPRWRGGVRGVAL